MRTWVCLALVSAAAAWSGTVPLAGLRSAPLRHAGIGLLGAGRPRDFAPAKGFGVQRNAHHLGRPDLHLHPRGLTHAHAAPAFSLSHRAWRAASVPCTGQQSKVALRAVVGELGAGAAFSKWFKGLSGAALAEAIRKTFAQFDSNGDGLLDREEFGGAMREMGLMLNEEELKLMFNEHDADGNGNIDSAEFTQMVMRYKDGDRALPPPPTGAVPPIGILLLTLTIVLEVVAATCMKLSNNFTNIVPSVAQFPLYAACFTIFSYALKYWPLSVAYAIWSGVGTAAIAAIGVVMFGEVLTAVHYAGIVAIVAGVVLMNL